MIIIRHCNHCIPESRAPRAAGQRGWEGFRWCPTAGLSSTALPAPVRGEGEEGKARVCVCVRADGIHLISHANFLPRVIPETGTQIQNANSKHMHTHQSHLVADIRQVHALEIARGIVWVVQLSQCRAIDDVFLLKFSHLPLQNVLHKSSWYSSLVKSNDVVKSLIQCAEGLITWFV